MKYFIKIFLLNIGLSFIALSCSSGKKMLEQGNYYQAVMQSVARLKNSPSNKKASETLAEAYPFAVRNLLDRLENNKTSFNKFKSTDAVYVYKDLNSMYEYIQSSPAAMSIINLPQKYYAALDRITPMAAEEQYQAGLEQLSYGGRNNAKQAYFYFLEANKFVENYRDVSDKIEIAYNLTILKVIVDLKPIQSRVYDLSADIFYKEVNRTLRQIEQNEFIRFFSPKEAKIVNISDPDQFLTINFEDFIVGETHIKERFEIMKSDSVKVSVITLKDGTKLDVYDIVTAEVSINRMEVRSNGMINLTVHEGNELNRDIINQNLAGEYLWFNEWGHFNGDERALTDAQYAICKQKRIHPIPPQQMFVEFTKPINEQLRNRLFGFYKNY
jgi:hypothetical protein